MPLIITATDFSQVADNAVNYACKLALAQDAELVVMHSFSIPLMFSDVPLPATFVNDAQHDAEAEMERLIAEMSSTHTGVNIKGSVVFGDIIDAIENYVTGHSKPWMIVVGNSLASDDSNWPDSTLIDVFRQIKYPVLAVPPGAAYNDVKNICFAFDNQHRGNIAAVMQLVDITEKLSAQLHVLNAGTKDTAEAAEIDPIVRNLLEPANPQYTIVADVNIDQAIEKFVAQNSAGILAMIPRKHSFFEGLFHKSHTKAVAHRSLIPMLALHDTQA